MRQTVVITLSIETNITDPATIAARVEAYLDNAGALCEDLLIHETIDVLATRVDVGGGAVPAAAVKP